GVGDLLRLLVWQAPTIFNTHFSQGDKDGLAARLILEPLVNLNSDGSLQPVLAAEVPSLENGGVAADGMSVTWKLKPDVVWSDGEPFTAEDVEFTWQYATNPDVAATTFATYDVISEVEVVDEHTITFKFAEPNPAWFTSFAGSFNGAVLPKHILADVLGPEARNAPFNLNPVGTGPYKVKEFRPGDTVLYEINENFREPDKPFFPEVELKGGGDATAAARAVLQSGETDYSWNLQIEKAVAEQMAASASTGVLVATKGNSVEQLLLNFADPNTEVDGARSEPTTEHPIFKDKQVRDAIRISSDRETIATQLYGEAGTASPNTLVAPTSFDSPNTSMEYDLEKAAALLDEAGWILDGNTRKKDGKELALSYMTTVNPVRQKTQEILKQSWEQIGMSIELRAIDAGVFFSSDAGNPDTISHFYADIGMFTNGPVSPYPLDYMSGFKSNEPETDIAQKSNSWSGNNYNRWVNEDFNKLWLQAKTELDPDTQAELFIGMNDLVVNEVVRIGLVHRNGLTGFSNRLKGHVDSSWEMEVYDIENWYAEE
ncbi:MAG TPA: peptide ABC transporter substrate-binding protein, partial [Thermomicrobiales bacterium]|nr:peptide ABC transporter substrate-binding protein [Thermomicrobiales bacterium]